MADSNIEWTDKVWNPVRGCVKVSPGCAHCYAETFAERFRGVPGHPYEQGFDLRLVPEKLGEPLTWKTPRHVFVNSMSDLFQDGVPDAYIDQVFAVMALTPWHTYQILTKRAERMRAYCSALTLARLLPWMNDHAPDGAPLKHTTPAGGFIPTGGENLCTVARRVKDRIYRFEPEKMPLRTEGPPLPNVWLGVSVENQHCADERIPLLLQTPAAVRFISAEPLLGPIAVSPFIPRTRPSAAPWALDWIIVGGESGSGARPCDLAWVRAIVAQCRAAGTACFVKQLGAKPLVPACRQTHWDYRFVKRPEDQRFTAHGVDRDRWLMHLADRKGGDMAEWPADLRVREYPGSTGNSPPAGTDREAR